MQYDVIVCGGGASGICAALAAKKENLNVLIIEDSYLLGGTNILSLVGPLMTYHNDGKRIIGGIAQDLVERLKNVNGTLGDVLDPLGFCSTVTPVDTEALKALYFELIDEYEIDVLFGSKIIGVKKDKGFITAVTVASKSGILEYYAKYFIDATGDGDICHMADYNYQIGRSSDNLCQPFTMPFVIGNVNLDFIKEEIKKDPSNFVLSNTYDYKYVGVSGFFKEVKEAQKNGEFSIPRDRVLLFENVRKNEVTINMTRISGLNPLSSVDLSEAERIGRRQIKETYEFLKKYVKGFENSVINLTPYKVGVRESRHIDCLYNVTKEDVFSHKKFNDSICYSAFPMDIHSPDGKTLDAIEVDSNDLSFTIPLRSIIPVDSLNLIVTGRSIGATHEAAASLRVTPVCMALGEAAGYLAKVCIKNNQILKDIDYKEVQELLLKHNCIF